MNSAWVGEEFSRAITLLNKKKSNNLAKIRLLHFHLHSLIAF